MSLFNSDAYERIADAIIFATIAHGDQKRKYTGEPYIVHPISVSKTVSDVEDVTVEMVMAAVLHDVIEDTEETYETVSWAFGKKVADLVLELTDKSTTEDGNRDKRKEIDRLNLSKASVEAKTIKLADLIDNSMSIALHDRGFARIYLKEKSELLKVLKEGDKYLYARAKELLVTTMFSLNIGVEDALLISKS